MVRQSILVVIRLYRKLASPLLPPACRFFPSCSEYAYLAVEKYGARRGGWLAIRRLFRCHPFVEGGYDPLI